ncbi:MAG: SMP-30/gluconolactonase/LRE family protein, partial [Steroidobacteraceae bacterium]
MKSGFIPRLVPLALAALASLSATAADVTPAIPDVVGGGTPIVLVKDGFEGVEGPLPQLDGGLLFTNYQAGKVHRIAPDGTVSVWFEAPVGANALTRTMGGEIVATLNVSLAIAVIQPGVAPRVLVGNYNGTPFNRPNDLVADRRGNIYFTDTVPLTATASPVIPSALYQLTAKGKLIRIATDIARPNGVALSPDERTLYVANTSGDWIYAYKLGRNGEVKKRSDFARLVVPPPANGDTPGSGADGLAVDDKARLYVATTLGVQVLTDDGKPLGIIAMPKPPQNLAFSGPNKG